MADSSLQEALKDHGSTFSGLLSLLPAKVYYGEGQTNPYGKQKFTKAERAAAKRGRLDPDSELNRSAKEELDARETKKRKLRELEEQSKAATDVADGAASSDIEGIEKEAPRQGMKPIRVEPKKKKQKTDEANDDEEDAEKNEKRIEREAKKKEKKEAKKVKVMEKKLKKKEAKIAAKASEDAEMEDASAENPKPKQSKDKSSKNKGNGAAKEADQQADDTTPKQATKDAKPSEPATETSVKPKKSKKEKAAKPLPTPEAESADEPASDVAEEPQAAIDTPEAAQPDVTIASTPDSDPSSPTFDAAEPAAPTTSTNDAVSTTSSVSSTVPPSEKPKHITLPADMNHFRERFQARMAVLKAMRKAPGTEEAPARSRKELMEQRRKKEEERKARKKEERRLAKIEEDAKREEALAANSPGAMSPATELDETTANFSFGRVAFNDNTQLSHDLSYVLNRDGIKKKGPSDPKTALIKLQNQKKRLAEMDGEKRDDVEGKEAWLTARRRAEGETVRDDEGILKKTIKRKDRQKRKSEREWSERAKGIEKAQEARQKKRKTNLKKRKDEKLIKKLGKKGIKLKKGRPGFEGTGLGSARNK